MTEPKTHTLEPPGATLTYDVRAAESESTAPVVLMIGSPMDASGFTTLAGHFPDRTVVTYDPRGVGRSPRADGVTGARRMSTRRTCTGLCPSSTPGPWTSSPVAGEP